MTIGMLSRKHRVFLCVLHFVSKLAWFILKFFDKHFFNVLFRSVFELFKLCLLYTFAAGDVLLVSFVCSTMRVNRGAVEIMS